MQLQAEVVRLQRDVVRGRALVARVGRLEVLGAGAAVAQLPALDEPLALLVAALGERQHREVQALHAAQRQLFQLVEAEVARVGPRVDLRGLMH